jgi:serine/threonine protein kinase
VLSTLGAGGMGVVFAAYDPHLDRKVALKLLRAGITYNTKDARTRLRREAQAIAQLSHPNVVNVYDVGTTDDGDLYIAMEFVEGDTLGTWLKNYPRTWREIVDVFVQAARGLIAAHGVGLLHRDFKPDNVLVGGDGRVRVTDFGLARSVIVPEEVQKPRSSTTPLSVDLTATGTVLGTPRYMAPEQLTGPEIDARADQFAFCVALYEALYNTHPLRGATSVAMLEQNERAFPPPEGVKLPASLGRVVMRGLERDRMKRFPSMIALINELAPPPPRQTLRYGVLALAGVLLIGGAVAAMVTSKPPDPEIPPPIQPLVAKINELTLETTQLKKEIQRIANERDVATQGRVVDQQKIDVLQAALDQREQEMSRVLDQVQKLLKQARANRTPPVVQTALIGASLDKAERSIEGCFNEWTDRTGKNEADVVIELVVNPDGGAHSANPRGPDDVLGFCLAALLVNKDLVSYPKGGEQLEVHIRIEWASGMLSMSPRIVGRRQVTHDGVDLR